MYRPRDLPAKSLPGSSLAPWPSGSSGECVRIAQDCVPAWKTSLIGQEKSFDTGSGSVYS